MRKSLLLLQQIKVESEASSSASEDSAGFPQQLVQIRPNEPEKYEVSVHQKFLAEIKTNLHDQFPHVDRLEAFSIFDPVSLLGQEAIAERS